MKDPRRPCGEGSWEVEGTSPTNTRVEQLLEGILKTTSLCVKSSSDEDFRSGGSWTVEMSGRKGLGAEELEQRPEVLDEVVLFVDEEGTTRAFARVRHGQSVKRRRDPSKGVQIT